MPDRFELHYAGTENHGRLTYRVNLRNAHILIKGSEKVFTLENISASGLAFHAPNAPFHAGERFIADVGGQRRTFLSNIKLEVVRVNKGNGLVACKMIDLDSHTEMLIDKLVLEVQKRELARKRSEA